MDIRPITNPHLNLDHLPLTDRDFQIKDTTSTELLLKIHCLSKDRHLNHTNDIGLWESNLPRCHFPQVHIFLEVVHICYACYVPSHRAIMSHGQKVLFTITAVSIKEMLQFQPRPNITALSIGDLQNQYPKLSPSRLTQLFQTFIVEEKHIPKDPPPYVSIIFSKWGQYIITMISCVLGYTTSEFIDELILAFMSIYTPRQPPATTYDFAKFIADRMYEQFTRTGNERVFKYSSVLYHLFLYYQSDKFPFSLQNLDTRGQHRPIIYWTPLFHEFGSPYTYSDFIDSFVYPIMTMLTGNPPPRISPE